MTKNNKKKNNLQLIGIQAFTYKYYFPSCIILRSYDPLLFVLSLLTNAKIVTIGM